MLTYMTTPRVCPLPPPSQREHMQNGAQLYFTRILRYPPQFNHISNTRCLQKAFEKIQKVVTISDASPLLTKKLHPFTNDQYPQNFFLKMYRRFCSFKSSLFLRKNPVVCGIVPSHTRVACARGGGGGGDNGGEILHPFTLNFFYCKGVRRLCTGRSYDRGDPPPKGKDPDQQLQ